jgi:hypothetical protein
MKKLISVLFILGITLLSCENKKYRYEIHGKVYVPTNGVSGLHDAIWLTDTISFDGDTLYYFNSDGSEVRISPPYKLIDKSLDK